MTVFDQSILSVLKSGFICTNQISPLKLSDEWLGFLKLFLQNFGSSLLDFSTKLSDLNFTF